MRVHLVCPPPSLEPPLHPPRHAPHYTAMVAAALRESGHDVSVVDHHTRTTSLPAIVADAKGRRPDLLLLMHSDYNRLIGAHVLDRVARALKEALPGVPVWGYGRLDAAHARRAAEKVPSLDGMLFDEPEFAAVALAEDRARGGSLTQVPGSVVRTDNGVVVHRPDAVELDAAPVPAWDLVPPAAYETSPHQSMDGVVWPVLASRGCPYPCFFCEIQMRPAYRTRSVDAVIAEFVEVHRRYGATNFFLADPTFAIEREWAMEFCRRLAAEGPPEIRWACMGRTDRVDAELLRAMVDAGCWNILFGIESLNPLALEAANKKLDPTTIGPAIRSAREVGLEVVASIMIGLPGDTPEGVDRTVSQLIAMEPDFAQFFVVQLGSDTIPEGGACVSEWDGSRYDFWGHVYVPDGFDGRDQLLALRRRAFRRFYLRPWYVAHRLGRVARSGSPMMQLRRTARGGLIALKLATGRA
ncbi:MAG: B12-binding domain-containing radical SAM protein [Proteobacteria bacterium]|nr:B12-binding domain-containing radical SAM protein [Pseudomonadota bacterium]